MSPPILDNNAVDLLVNKEMLTQRTDAAIELRKGDMEGMKRPTALDVLQDLRIYIQNTWKKDGKREIQLQNKRFLLRFGPEGSPCFEVLEMLKFDLTVRSLSSVHARLLISSAWTNT